MNRLLFKCFVCLCFLKLKVLLNNLPLLLTHEFDLHPSEKICKKNNSLVRFLYCFWEISVHDHLVSLVICGETASDGSGEHCDG